MLADSALHLTAGDAVGRPQVSATALTRQTRKTGRRHLNAMLDPNCVGAIIRNAQGRVFAQRSYAGLIGPARGGTPSADRRGLTATGVDGAVRFLSAATQSHGRWALNLSLVESNLMGGHP